MRIKYKVSGTATLLYLHTRNDIWALPQDLGALARPWPLKCALSGHLTLAPCLLLTAHDYPCPFTAHDYHRLPHLRLLFSHPSRPQPESLLPEVKSLVHWVPSFPAPVRVLDRRHMTICLTQSGKKALYPQPRGDKRPRISPSC